MKTIQLTPSCKDYLWGGEKLRTEYGIQSELHPLSEAWMLSCNPDGPSYLPDGSPYQQYINTHTGCKGTSGFSQYDYPAAGHVFAAVVAHAFLHGNSAGVAHGKPCACPSVDVDLAAGGYIEEGVARDGVVFRSKTAAQTRSAIRPRSRGA